MEGLPFASKSEMKPERTVVHKNFLIQLIQLIVPTPLVGGRNYILKRVFFVQSILADRCIRRREM